MATNIVLIGFMGSGKSSVAEALGKYCHFDCLDTDTLIEKKERVSISEIFNTHGEAYFRQCEKDLFRDLRKKTDCLISTGGGFPIQKSIQENFSNLGICIYLQSDFETCLSRIKKSETRPLLKEKKALLLERYQGRLPIYEQLADITVRTDNHTIEDIAKIAHSKYTELVKLRKN